MKTVRLSLLVLTAILLVTGLAAMAAPVESVASGGAAAARQKIDAFLGEQLVAQQLAALGLSQPQVQARLAQLSDGQIEELAGQIDLVQAGGTIEGGNPHPTGPLRCILAPLGRLLYNIYQLVFCWGDLR